ncbi:MAG: hypothetical protein IPM18_16965 [Phycisphaerales bacterium]|nr:hypothetical protein [Phycisphaerales bacterium]
MATSERFHALRPDEANATYLLERVDPATGSIRTGAATTCPCCGAFTSMLNWLPPYEGALECSGNRFGDIVEGAGDTLVVSERFRALYHEYGLTGLEGFDPVSHIRLARRGNVRGAPPLYYRVTATRSRAAVDLERSGIVWDRAPTCDECRTGVARRWEAIIIEPGTWSGEDIFYPRGLRVRLVSDRFRELCESWHVCNAVCIPAEEYWHDMSPEDDSATAYAIMRKPLGEHVREKVIRGTCTMRLDETLGHIVIAEPAVPSGVEQRGAPNIRGHFRPHNPAEFWSRHVPIG